MKMKFLCFAAIFVMVASCKKEEEDNPVLKTITIISDRDMDGHVINSSPKTVKTAEKRLDIGWTGGAATRAFLSYDITEILPPSDRKLVIDKAILKVYEKNTNMLPFTGEGGTRVVEVYTLNYGTLDATDFDCATLENCGVITNTGYSVLKEYTLDVTHAVNSFLEIKSPGSSLQFRLQLTNNENVSTSTSTLGQAMWSLYSGEDQGNYNDYKPCIVLTYKWIKK